MPKSVDAQVPCVEWLTTRHTVSPPHPWIPNHRRKAVQDFTGKNPGTRGPTRVKPCCSRVCSCRGNTKHCARTYPSTGLDAGQRDCLGKNKLFIVIRKNTRKDLSAIKMLQSPLWEIEQLCKGPESGAMTPGLSLLASQAGRNETFQFTYCKNPSHREGARKKGENLESRLDLGSLLSSSCQKHYFQRL